MIIGLEGVSGVGKTTLAETLAATLHNALVVPCYYHAAPDPGWLPPVETRTAAAQLISVTMLLRIEALRLRQVREAVRAGRHVILDRTVDTILAHTHAMGRLHGFDADTQARSLISWRPVAVPEVTLLLRADPQELGRRAGHRPGLPAILYDPTFTGHFHDHFREPVVTTCIGMDSSTTPEQVAAEALSWLPVTSPDGRCLSRQTA